MQEVLTLASMTSRRFVLSWLNHLLKITAVPQRHQSFAWHTFQFMDLTKITTATTATYTGKNSIQNGFVGTMDAFYVIMELRKTMFPFTTTNMYHKLPCNLDLYSPVLLLPQLFEQNGRQLNNFKTGFCQIRLKKLPGT